MSGISIQNSWASTEMLRLYYAAETLARVCNKATSKQIQ